MFMSGGSQHGEGPGGSCLLLQEANGTYVRSLLSQRIHLPLMTHAYTHISHTQKHVETVFLSILSFSFSMHTLMHTSPPAPPLILAHNGRLMSPRPSGLPQGALQL